MLVCLIIYALISITEPNPPQTREGEDEEKQGDDEETSDAGRPQDGGGEENADEKPKKSTKELPIDANHPEVMQIVNEVMAEAEKREPELSPDEYTDVIEEALQKRYAELQEMNPDGPQ